MATVDPAPQPRLSDPGESAFGEDVEAVALLGSTSWGSACYRNMHPTSQSEPRWAWLLISPQKAPKEAVHRPFSAAFAAMQPLAR
jgi:hypothetical protein